MKEKKHGSYEPVGTEQNNEKANWNIKPYLAMALLAFIIVCLCMVVFFALYRFDSVRSAWNKVMGVLQPIIIGFVIAYLINPIMKLIERNLDKALEKRMSNEKKRKKLTRAVGTAGALVFFVLIIILLIEMVMPQLIRSISGMVTTLPDQVENLIKWVDDFMSGDSKNAQMIEEGIRKVSDYLSDWFQTSVLPDIQTYVTAVTGGLINVVKVLLNVLVGLIIAAYLLFSKEKFIGQSKKIVYAILPVRQANVIVHTVRKSNEIFGGFISGKILDSAIIGVLCYIVLSIMQMPYTLLVSVIVGVTNVIPFFGPFIGGIPSAIIIALASPIQGLYFVIFVIVLQQLDGNIIGPKILGNSTGLSPFWVVFAILVGGGLFGFTGMVLGVPAFAVVYYIISNVISYILRKRKLPDDTGVYIAATSVDLKTNRLVYEEKETEDERNERNT
jgi:predicted PurR-regulated permease PerM